jgi:WhiB family redox-sensing transcriptional regulator
MTYRPFYDVDDIEYHKRRSMKAGLAMLAAQIIGDDITRPKPFQGQPLCAETDPDLFFPEKHDAHSSRAARAICQNCPMRDECLTIALQNHEQFGVWGGQSLKERRRGTAQRVVA